MAKDTPIVDFLTPDEQAMLTPAAKTLNAGDMITALWRFKHKDSENKTPEGRPQLTPAAEALSMKDWESIARAFVSLGMRRHHE